MTTYTAYLGFNWNAAEMVNPLGNDGDSSGLYPLQNALSVDIYQPVWYNKFTEGDKLAFWIYDLANVSDETWSLQLSVYLSLSGSAESVLVLQPTTVSYFGTGTCPVWSQKQKIPQWEPSPRAFTLEQEGIYEVSAGLQVTDPNNDTKPFVFDPEIIVGGGE